MMSEKPKLVFVYIGKQIPSYALASIRLANKYSNLRVCLLANREAVTPAIRAMCDVYLIDDFYEPSQFTSVKDRLQFDLSFRNGFWAYTLERFFVLSQFMNRYEIRELFHGELDNLFFGLDDLHVLVGATRKKGIFMPLDDRNRVIASLLYINSANSLREFVQFVDSKEDLTNDMELLAEFFHINESAYALPCIEQVMNRNYPQDLSTDRILNYSMIGFIDAASLGQWISGEDPRNSGIRGHFNHFLNPNITLSEQFSTIQFRLHGNHLFLKYLEHEYRVFNLHIHSKIHHKIENQKFFLHLLEASSRKKRTRIQWDMVRVVKNFLSQLLLGVSHIRRHLNRYIKRKSIRAGIVLIITFISNVCRLIPGKHLLNKLLERQFKHSKSIFPAEGIWWQTSRSIYEATLPEESLFATKDTSTNSQIFLIIPCTLKDVQLLPTVLHATKQNVRDDIVETQIICPDHEAKEISALVGNDINIVSETEIIPKQLQELITCSVPAHRKNWVTQQVIKWNAVAQNSRASLVVDSDTVLLKPTQWCSGDKRQRLEVSTEFHLPYQVHYEKLFGNTRLRNLSFVTHCQLMRPDIVRELFGTDLDKLVRWISQADWNFDSPISEYHTYGHYLSTKYWCDTRLTQWNNRSSFHIWPTLRTVLDEPASALTEIIRKYKTAHSVSFHSYSLK